MVYVTGDTHGKISRFTTKAHPLQKAMTEKDVLLVAGDFGFTFPGQPRWQEEGNWKALEALPYTVAFCDGNHENFDRLDNAPLVGWNGGQAHRLARNVFHLPRGELYTIQGFTVFTFGGAWSIDEEYRIPFLSWWPQEKPTREEYRHGWDTLDAAGGKVDYILTHTAPGSIIRAMGFQPAAEDKELTQHLQTVWNTVEFRHWFFGHWHLDCTPDPKATCLFENVCPINYAQPAL